MKMFLDIREYPNINVSRHHGTPPPKLALNHFILQATLDLQIWKPMGHTVQMDFWQSGWNYGLQYKHTALEYAYICSESVIWGTWWITASLTTQGCRPLLPQVQLYCRAEVDTKETWRPQTTSNCQEFLPVFLQAPRTARRCEHQGLVPSPALTNPPYLWVLS